MPNCMLPCQNTIMKRTLLKMTNHNSKTAGPNVEIEEYKNAMAKWQSIIAEHQGTVTNQHIVEAK